MFMSGIMLKETHMWALIAIHVVPEPRLELI